VQETPVRPGAPPSAREPGRRPEAEARRVSAAPPGPIEQKAGRRADVAAAKERAPAHPAYDLGAGAIDVSAILAGEKAPESRASGTPDIDEIDLSSVLGDIKAGRVSVQAGAPAEVPAGPAPVQGRDLEEVFEEFRREVMREQATSTAAQHYRLALTYHDMGMTEECLKALEVAARSPRYRFQAASLLGRVHRHHGRLQEAIDWFERAAETPASSAEAGRALLYELGQALEEAGEGVRALAVYLELQADAGDYRDVGARIKRLSR